MKKIFISLEILLIIAFVTLNNVSAYVTNEITYSVSYKIYDNNSKQFIKQEKNSILIFMKNKGAYINQNGTAVYQLPDFSNKKYFFDGWYLDKDLTKKVKDNDVRNINFNDFQNSNQTLYGKYVSKTNKVSTSLIVIIVFLFSILFGIAILLFQKKNSIINKISMKKTPNK